ncbi:MAG: glycosyltransferase family 9 protein [Calditrichaeota bacterium]|nr:MAG: glycosyltransferase family 9 protein [Calditrichota bacterium]
MHEPDWTHKRILLIRTDRLGDVILSTPVAVFLKKRFPSCRITFLVSQNNLPVVRACPAIDHAFAVENFLKPNGKLDLRRFVHALREKNFDVVLHLHPRFDLALAAYLARIPVRAGTGYRFYSMLFNARQNEHRKTAQFHEAEYNLRLLQPLGFKDAAVEFSLEFDEAAQQQARALLQEQHVSLSRPLVVVHPGSGGSSRDWPPGAFAQLADRLMQERGVEVVVTGSVQDGPVLEAFYAHSQMKPPSLAGRLSLETLGALLQLADVFVGNSTGPLHLAVAVGTEVVSFYPPIRACRPERWGPYGRRQDVLMSRVEECYHCRKRYERYCDCMVAIPVQAAFDKVSEKLSYTLNKDKNRSEFTKGTL